MNSWNSAIYAGKVTHKRLRPKAHFLRYRMFYMFFDIDELGALSEKSRLFSYNRFNFFSFFNKDHGYKSSTDAADKHLRIYAENRMSEAGITPDGGKIQLMTMPRILGYVFNPLSVYYCYDLSQRLRVLIYEVNNTFGQRHSYIFPLGHGVDVAGPLHQQCNKEFYVSPFLEMELGYDFTITQPGSDASIVINARDDEGLIIATAFTGKRLAFGDRALSRLIFAYPLLTLKVIFGIHWEALRLWIKGVRLTIRPTAPRQTKSVISGTETDLRHVPARNIRQSA
ncbi:DUF1365 family protein [Phyllobacterium sp. YR531]|uniref:DUF1365 domain-containing protein n=1 Tax=Phyllobacterium sp. YR531 TaxID=1144343 RepID=UPI00026F990F|nr:DUF1365 family protein [Phyllobacterium sp. YR531]EJN00549.1 hypothetical protein PMI41_03572 [Phyllobacterium sp. YR531]